MTGELMERSHLKRSVVSIIYIAVPIQMRYNITSPGVGARQCRAPTGVPHINENRYIQGV
ncbi:MAG: hypothetical protein V7K55_23840 [Nostoc sp.]|uniref:hypothetical protein n=1 Tax=Nostoc sp. TaxID=1180 RepID=UPI002FF8A677